MSKYEALSKSVFYGLLTMGPAYAIRELENTLSELEKQIWLEAANTVRWNYTGSCTETIEGQLVTIYQYRKNLENLLSHISKEVK